MDELNDAMPSGLSRADRSITEALSKYTLLLDRTGRAYALPKQEANATALAIQSTAFKKRLRKDAHNRGDLLRQDDLSLILDDLNAHAAIQDEPVDIYLRVAPSMAGGIEIDLGTPDRARVRLHGDGHRIGLANAVLPIRNHAVITHTGSGGRLATVIAAPEYVGRGQAAVHCLPHLLSVPLQIQWRRLSDPGDQG